MKTTVRFEGARELDRKLARLGRSLPEKVQRRILREAGEIVEAEAKALVPVLTGSLRDSITITDDGLGGAFKMDRGLGDGSVSVFIGPRKTGGKGADGFHGHFVEFGTINMAAQPFMRPAFDNTQGQVMSRIAGDVSAEVMKAVKA